MNSPTTQQCERWLDELAELASTGISEGEFYQRYLQYVIQATHADAGGLWRVVENGFRLVSQQGLREKGLAQNEAISSFHEYELAQVTASQITRHTSRRPLAQTDGGSVMSPTTGNDCWTFFPCLANGRVFAVLEIVRAADRLATDEATQGLLAAFGEIARDYYSVEVLQAQTADLQLWEAFAKYARAIHADLEPSLTAYTVVNECRRLLQLDRVTLVRMQSDRASIWAVSGIDQVDHRSALVRTAEDLFTVLARTGERFEYREGQGDLAPEIDDRLQPYLDASATRWMQIHPLRSDQTTKGREPIRALLCWELFSEKPTPRVAALGPLILNQTALAVAHAEAHAQAQRAWWHHQSLKGRSFGVKAMASVTVMILLALLMAWPTTFYVEAVGAVQPLHLQHLFAPIDAEVRELHVSAGQAVERDTPLITLESRELALSREKLQGEKLAAEERLRGLESSRLVDRPRAATDLPDQLSVSASEREYREQLASLAAQLAIIEAQAAGLIIRSPTQGTVLTWDLEQRLRSRPVQIGQRLLSVADLNGPWELRLHVPEATSGFVLEAWKTPATELPIEFHLMARPSEHWAAVLTELSIESTLSEAGESGLECRAHIDRPLDPQPRPGQIVRARINCGRRPRAVVWFHDLIRVWHTYVW